MLANDVLHTIGNTPHIRINRLFGPGHTVYIKSERSNPGGSIKDRIALAMVEAAESSGALKPGGTIIEPTSGNTGIGLAMVAAVKGYELVLVMPESMSLERRRLMLAYGASFDLTPKEGGMKGASRYLIITNVPAHTKSAQIRLAGTQTNTTLIFDLRIDVDYNEPAGGFKPVKITYNWDESGAAKSDVHVAKSESDNWSINCGKGAQVKSFTMELAE